MSEIDDLLAGNERYAAGFGAGDLPAPPARRLAVGACMDARIDVHRILGLAEGDAHVIRNAGGVVTEDTIRSLVVSQRLLGTEEVLVMQHTRCGMRGFDEEELRHELRRETGAEPGWAVERFGELEDDVRRSVARVEASPFLPRTDAVRGFVYEVETGRLREVV